MRKPGLIMLLGLLLPLVCRPGPDLADRAQAAFQGRGDPAKALLAIELCDQLARQNPGDLDSRIKVGRLVYWVIEEQKSVTERSRKIELFEKAIKNLREVIDKDEDNVAAWHWMMWDMGALTLAKGVFSGWNLKDGVIGTIMVSKGDVNFFYGGVYRHWARLIYETPKIMSRFLHFTDLDSIWIYKRAIAVEPNYLLNHFWLAETYEKIGRRQEAGEEYEFCANLPDGALLDMVPENRLYKKLARERLKNFN